MKGHPCKFLLCLGMLGLTLSSHHAAVVGIDSITLGTSNELLTATIGGTAYGGGVIADSAQDNETESGLGAATTGGPLITGNTTVFQVWDNNVLSGSSGGQSDPQTDGLLQLFWGTGQGGFTDNDADPDFFVFEDLGNDTVVARAILANDTYGATVNLSGWNAVRTDGVLNNNQFLNRTVTGVAFHFTDLLDASGANLTNGTTIKGIWIGQENAADFFEIYANVSPIPEPSSALLIGLAGLVLLHRRRR